MEENESFEEGALRELEEESFLRAQDLKKRGYLVFRMEEMGKFMKVHVYEAWQLEGAEAESDEMRPQWYEESEIPFDNMWPDDPYWLPLLLNGNKMVIGR